MAGGRDAAVVTATGLTEVEAKRRLAARGTPSRRQSSRSYASILRANTLTIPNGILFVFGVLTIVFASWRDALFLGILVSNIAIGSFQEIRSKRALDRLAALVAPDARWCEVLSGDAPPTVGAIAHDAGIPGAAAPLDGEALPSDPAALRDAVMAAPAVGRISPEGKRAVLGALESAGRYTAMVGDGVNDVPALKAARLAIAQGSGAQIARSVADLVLVRDDFALVPAMVAEGRQILRNIQRVARLFITKSVFAAVAGLAIAIPTGVYPLLPRQFTIASTVTIGIPAFVLALAPSTGPWRPERFLQEVARFAVPAGVAIGTGIVAGYVTARYGFDLSLARSRTVATGIVVVCGLAVLMRIESGNEKRRLELAGLCVLMALLFALALVVPSLRHFYELATPTGEAAAAWAIGTTLGVGAMLGALRVLRV